MRAWVLSGLVSIIASLAVAADRAGEFDYYVLSLSWSPNWCDRTGHAQGSEQCDADRDLGWSLHGLWPQYEQGWPSYCPTNADWPSRRETAQMADIMGTSGLAFHQWKKHGVCSGLDSGDYFALSRDAYNTITPPPVFRKLTETYSLPASIIEDAFLQDNPQLSADQITVKCKDFQIQEVRICLDKDLEPRVCGQDVIKDCTLDNAIFHPIP